MFYEWNFPLAEQEFSRSIALNPNDAESHLFYYWYLAIQQRMKEARAEIETAAALDPLSVIVATRVGTLAWIEGRNADAETALRGALQLDSTFHMARTELSAVLLAEGKREAARAMLPPPEEILPGASESAWPAMVRVALGDTAGAKRMLAEIEAMRARRYVSADLVGTVKLALGDKAGALDDFERAANERAFPLILIGVYPVYQVLDAEPRFQRLFVRLGLPPLP